MILNVIMIFAACCAAGAWLVTWAKLDEQKKLTQEERDRRWDEISRAVGLENEFEAEKGALNAEIARLNQCLDTEFEFADEQIDKNRELQDRLSALLCPTENHVWKDGCCVKCGRARK